MARSTADPAALTPRKPPWLRVHVRETPEMLGTRAILRRRKLGTVCEEAACPNLHECWSQRHATVMVLGTVCTSSNAGPSAPRPRSNRVLEVVPSPVGRGSALPLMRGSLP